MICIHPCIPRNNQQKGKKCRWRKGDEELANPFSLFTSTACGLPCPPPPPLPPPPCWRQSPAGCGTISQPPKTTFDLGWRRCSWRRSTCRRSYYTPGNKRFRTGGAGRRTAEGVGIGLFAFCVSYLANGFCGCYAYYSTVVVLTVCGT